MPATVTHAYFSYDVYNELDNTIKNKVDVDRIKLFGQSTDPLMFYFINKDIRKLQNDFHTKKSKDYFINLLNYIKDNKLYDKDVYSYVFGFICHYVLDSNIHPFVFYKTGHFKKKVPNTYKYNNRHHFMEVYIDNYMIKTREKINPYKFNISKYSLNRSKFSDKLNKVIDYSFSSTYKVNNISKIYYKSIKYMKLSLSLFRKDRFGIKKFFYKLIDTFTPRSFFRFEAVSYHYPLNDKHNYLNSNHELWRNPIDYDITSTDSFIELYIKSLKEAKYIIEEVFKYFDNEDIKLDKLFTNKSYVTGLDCNIKKELKYFEF